jgi:hypothetical protein
VSDPGGTTGADFATAFLAAMKARGADVSAFSTQQLGYWFDLALEEGRRTRPPAVGWLHLTSASVELGQLAIRPEDIVVVAEQPDATVIRVDGQWLPVTEEYAEVVQMAAIP